MEFLCAILVLKYQRTAQSNGFIPRPGSHLDPSGKIKGGKQQLLRRGRISAHSKESMAEISRVRETRREKEEFTLQSLARLTWGCLGSSPKERAGEMHRGREEGKALSKPLLLQQLRGDLQGQD